MRHAPMGKWETKVKEEAREKERKTDIKEDSEI